MLLKCFSKQKLNMERHFMSNTKNNTDHQNQNTQFNHSSINTAGLLALSKTFSNGLLHVANCCMEYEDREEWELALNTLRTFLISAYHGLSIDTEDVDADEVIKGLTDLAVIQTKLYEPEV